MTLTGLQIRHFRDQGYLVLPTVGLHAQPRDALADVIRGAANGLHTGEHKVYSLYQRAPELMHRIVTDPALTGPLTDLLGPNLVYVLNRHNQGSVNAPGGAEPRLHRDILQPTRGLITVVLYLEDADLASGCTWVVPGSHLLPFVGVPQPNGGGTWMDEHPDLAALAAQAVPVPVPAGGALVFDGTLFHTAGQNSSDHTRTSAVLGYRSVDELEHSPDTDRQVLAAGQYIYRGNDRPAA